MCSLLEKCNIFCEDERVIIFLSQQLSLNEMIITLKRNSSRTQKQQSCNINAVQLGQSPPRSELNKSRPAQVASKTTWWTMRSINDTINYGVPSPQAHIISGGILHTFENTKINYTEAFGTKYQSIFIFAIKYQ